MAGLATAVTGSTSVAETGDSDFIRDLGCDQEFEALSNGDKLAGSGDYEKARLEFARAWRVLRSPKLLFKLADAEERSGHHADAFSRFGEFVALTEPASPSMKMLATYESHDPKEIDAMRAEATRRLAHLQPRIGELYIACPPDARVTIDGIEVSHGRIFVGPGAHVVTASAGGQEQTVNIVTEPGSITRVALLGAVDRR